MAYQPWWEKLIDMNSESEREAFMRGIYGSRPSGSKTPIIAGLISGTLLAASMAKKGKKK